jgi:hypothetical protein
VTIYDAEGWILRAPVSSGTTGRETPAGVFSVVQKDKDHHSNLYDDAWMPNMLRITWSGIALQTQLDTVEANAKSKLDAATAAQDAAKAAEARQADAAKAAREAKLVLDPVSVFISRMTQRLYVRHGFEATLEVPVTIRDQDKPIGTHVFTAVARTDRGLRWTAVTIDSGDNAQAALDRISIPQDVLDRIAPTALPRSSLIISDEPLNRETNYRTEFVVALHNQPQGGLAMRRAPTEIRVARGNAGGYYGFTRWLGGQYYDQRRQGWWW